MNTHEQQLDQVLRKALDEVDKRSIVSRTLVIGLIGLGVVFLVIAARLSAIGSHDLLRHEILGGFAALALFVAAAVVGIIRVANRNTRTILKAISLLSKPGSN